MQLTRSDLINGDCLEKMKDIPSGSVDGIVTDPPYGLEFMGKEWDKGVPGVEFWVEMIRVLKPGGYLLSFSGTRTYHRMATAIEDAGFEIRDMIEWVYGSGFPKSLNIGKAVDKLQGNEREDLGVDEARAKRLVNQMEHSNPTGTWQAGKRIVNISKGTSEWEGWGTALKPAHEPICMARKPLSEKTVAENVLKWGTGGINIDASRVGTNDNLNGGAYSEGKQDDKEWGTMHKFTGKEFKQPQGRFPANLIHDNSEEVRECFPESKSSDAIRKNKTAPLNPQHGWNANNMVAQNSFGFNDQGNASRFFKSIIYTAKASKAERNKGCEGLEERETPYGSGGGAMPSGNNNPTKTTSRNNHPTVKPVALMEYLIEMITTEGGTVLDPFMGSGTTGVACKNLARNFIGIELDPEYIKIAESRIQEPKEKANDAKHNYSHTLIHAELERRTKIARHQLVEEHRSGNAD